MTLEKNSNHHAPYRQSPSRFSIQSTTSGRDSPAPNYENKEVFTEAVQRLGRRDCPPPLPPNRRHSSNDDHSHVAQAQEAQPHSNNASPQSPQKSEVQKMYENVPGRSTQHVPHSPTKQRGRYPLPPLEPISDGYYNVSPPLALKNRYTTSGSSPPNLSQEEDPFSPPVFPVVPPPPIKTISSSQYTQDMYADTYLRPQQHSTCTKIEGENLVVQRISTDREGSKRGGRTSAMFTGKEEPGMYQNIDFMNKKSTTSTNYVYIEDTDG